MPYLMHIAFDNAMRLSRRVQYFQYAGVRFKLIQNNPRRWSDVLLTIVPSDDTVAEQHAYSIAGEFLSALSWQNHSAVAVRPLGGTGIPIGFPLRRAVCQTFDFPEAPFLGNVTGFGISRIAQVSTPDQRTALTLLREARSSNKRLLSFLLLWQVMEVGAGDPIGWINRIQARRPRGVHLDPALIRRLPLAGRRLGEYLRDDCRHAIAHVRRRRGGRSLQFDVSAEDRRMSISTGLAEELATHYIRIELGLRNSLYLQHRQGEFPVYVDERGNIPLRA